MISVIDTSVLITFYQLKSIHFLGYLFNEVYVPLTVEKQFLKKETEQRFDFLLKFYEENQWFKKCQTYQDDVIGLLLTDKNVDEGEREAIAQYKKIQSDLEIEEGRIHCIIDERYARAVAAGMNIEIKGTLYLLAKLHFLGHLDYFTIVRELRNTRRFSKKYIKAAFEKVKLEMGID